MPTTPLNIPLAVYSAIADAIQAEGVFKSVNVIRFDQIEGIQDAAKPNTADGDYPQAMIRGPISGGTDLATGDVTFGTYADDGPCDWMETAELVYEVTVTSDLLRQQNTTDQTIRAINAIRLLGPRLGLPYVTGVKIRFTEKDVQSDDAADAKRVETRLTVTVNCQNEGRTLTGE